MSCPYDLHSHSTASDGTLTPSALVERAAGAGVGVLALTDHDTLEGLAEAREAAGACGIGLVPGVEISVTWSGTTVHILGLGVDPDSPELSAGLAGLRGVREGRALEMGERLARAGIAGAYQGARERSNGRLVSRTHFARFLVDAGHARDLRDVFRHYLVPGRPGFVAVEWAPLAEAVAWIRAAGGQAVIAHPARYKATRSRLRRLVAEFKAAGGEGIEVVSGSHSRDDVYAMAALAAEAGLLASAGSDYHGPEHPWIELGRLHSLPPGCRPIWQAWSLAA